MSKQYIATFHKRLPELPHERFKRYIEKFGLTPYNASILVNDKDLSDYFEEAVKHHNNPKALCNWITVEFVGRLKNNNIKLSTSGIIPKHIAELISYIDSKEITGRIAKDVADIMVQYPGKDPTTIIKDNPNFQAIHDKYTIDPIVNQVLEENPQSVQDFKKGKDKALNFLVGQVMKLSHGKASPDVVKNLMKSKLD